MKIFNFFLDMLKKCVILPRTLHTIGAISEKSFEPINGNACYGGGMETIRYITPSVCGVHTYGGRCFLS